MRRRYVPSIPIAPVPSTSARRGPQGWRPPTARTWRSPRSADGRRLGEHAEPPERRRHRDEVLRRLGDELAREAVQARDAALEVVAGVAGVGRARRRTRAQRPHDRRTVAATRSPRAKPWPSRATAPTARGRGRACPRRRARRRTGPRRSRGRCRRRRPRAGARGRPPPRRRAPARSRRRWSRRAGGR